MWDASGSDWGFQPRATSKRSGKPPKDARAAPPSEADCALMRSALPALERLLPGKLFGQVRNRVLRACTQDRSARRA